MLKDAQICVLPMVVAEDALTEVVPELLEGDLVCAFVMEVAKDVRLKIVPRVQKGYLVFASPMEVVGAATFLNAPKGHKEAQCSARPMVGASGARFSGAQRELKEARLFVKLMVEEKGVLSKEAGYVPRVFMEVLFSVWLTEVERDVLYQIALRVQEVGQISVSAMVEARDASFKDVIRVLKAALTSARHMVEGKDACGDSLGQSLPFQMLLSVTGLLGESLVSVLLTVPWCKTSVFTVVGPFYQLSLILNLAVPVK